MINIYLLGCLIALVMAVVATVGEVKIGHKLFWLDYVLLAIFVTFSWVSVIWLTFDAIIDKDGE